MHEGANLISFPFIPPVIEKEIAAFKKENFILSMMNSLEEESLRYLYLLQPVEEQEKAREIERSQRKQEMVLGGGDTDTEKQRPVIRGQKIRRNDPCPCGSGKKYKKCCALTAA